MNAAPVLIAYTAAIGFVAPHLMLRREPPPGVWVSPSSAAAGVAPASGLAATRVAPTPAYLTNWRLETAEGAGSLAFLSFTESPSIECCEHADRQVSKRTLNAA